MRRVNTVCIITWNGNGKEEKGVTGGRAKWGCGGGGSHLTSGSVESKSNQEFTRTSQSDSEKTAS
jgi:hypothetical protein